MLKARKRTYNITALQRGLQILGLFSKEDSGLTASEVVKLSGLPVSTVHRLLVNLESAGYVSCDGSSIYQLAAASLALGQAALAQMDLRRVSLPYLRELNRQTRETVHLTVRHGLTAVYVEKLDSPEPLRIHSRIGSAIPLHSTAVGKVLLAYMPAAEQSKVLDQLDLRRLTRNTVGSIQELKTQLNRVLRNEYACDLEENELHIRCIAAPVRDHQGAVNASFSITGPSVRMAASRLRQLAPLVCQTSVAISKELGYRGQTNHTPR
jgi:IclR family transcriptional regulator, KDG regulon repressor